MFHKERSVLLRSSASALNNNLSLLPESSKNRCLRIAVVHRSTVNLINLTDYGQFSRQITSKDNGQNGGSLVLQAKWCQISDKIVLVVTSQNGIQIYDAEGTILLHWHPFRSSGDVKNDVETYARGICTLGKKYILIGTHDGNILSFLLPPDERSISLVATYTEHSVAIGDLDSDENTLASGDDSGKICIWHLNDDNGITVVHSTKSYGSPCTSIALCKDSVLSGYTTGHLRIFSTVSGSILAEMCAHCRAVTSVDIASQAGLGLSSSEDGYVHVWNLKDGKDYCMPVFSEKIPNSQLYGAQFISSKGNGFCISSYDSEELICYTV